MLSLDDIKPGALVRGIDPGGIAEIVQIAHFGADALNLVFGVNGRIGERLLFRGEEISLDLVEAGRAFGFDSDGALLRLASEAYRIRLAHLFDPFLAVSASQIEALPHQITAVCGGMVPLYAARVGDLSPRDAVMIECGACGHTTAIPPIRRALSSCLARRVGDLGPEEHGQHRMDAQDSATFL
jgi:hypothetical protein